MADNNRQSDFRFSAQFEPDLFWEQHGRQVLGVLLAVAAIGLVIFLWQQGVTRRVDEAAQRLATAHDPGALEAIIRDYPAQNVAAQAQLRLADWRFAEGRHAEAAQQYQEFLQQFPRHPLAVAAQLGLAAVTETQGNLPAARQQYEQLAPNPAGNYTVALAKFGAARCAEAMGQLKEARLVYEELMALTQNTPLQSMAYLRWAITGRESPAASVAAPVVQPPSTPASQQ